MYTDAIPAFPGINIPLVFIISSSEFDSYFAGIFPSTFSSISQHPHKYMIPSARS